jgi:hypothetical protein
MVNVPADLLHLESPRSWARTGQGAGSSITIHAIPKITKTNVSLKKAFIIIILARKRRPNFLSQHANVIPSRDFDAPVAAKKIRRSDRPDA